MSKILLKDRVEFVYGFSVRINGEQIGEYPVYGSNGPTGFIDNFKVSGPGVIIGRKGSVGKVNFTKKNFTPTDTTYYLEIKDPKKDDLNFWYYYLPLLGLEKLNTHSSVPGLSREVAYVIPVCPPDLITQQKITSTLSILEDKIELNNRIITELEIMAKTLYDYWFVQFDFPDIKGKPYKSSGGEMVRNEKLKRNIPKGWEVKTLLDIADFTNGLACQKYRPKENEQSYKVIKIREMNEGFSENSEFVTINIPKKYIIRNGDVLFSWSATLDVKIWTGGIGGLNQHIFKVTSEKYPKFYFYFELLNYLRHFKMMAELRKTTMGHITQEHLKQSMIIVPPVYILEELKVIIDPILDKIVKAQEENQKLVELRDWLLPMLMNGQVKVA